MEAPLNSSPFWAQDTKSLIENLGSNPDSGLTEQQIEKLTVKFGKNTLKEEKTVSSFTLILRQFKNPMVYTLLLATVISYAVGETIDAIAIFAIVILNAGIGFTQESKSEAAIQSLKKMTVPKARVFRDGKVKNIDAINVLPGDILQLEAGDYVVADSRLIEAYQLSADESILTGESLSVEKNVEQLSDDTELGDRENMIFAGTAISSGSGKGVVTSIGMETEIGQIAGLLQDTHKQATPLQQRLDKVSNKLLMLGGVVIVIVVILGFNKGEDWLTIFMTAISLSVAAIPEGLPTIVTLALTLAVRRMTKRNALVRNMAAVETLGSTDIICTDKTGTLTTGKMRVREMFSLEEGTVEEERFKGSDTIFSSMVLCNNSSLDHGGSGDTTEIALLLLAQGHNIDVNKMKQEKRRVHEWSFESDRKRMSVAIEEGKELTIFCKGAPDSLLPLCRLSSSELLIIEKAVHDLSSKGRRILALAHKEESSNAVLKQSDLEVEKDFHFLGLVAIADPPKEESILSIKQCKAAGIKVVMITGDHPVTANAIAHELGIPVDGTFDQVMTGHDLNTISKEEMRLRVEKTSVYARVTPEHKLRIIEALQANGHVVSMTGDGVNDAPALKKASIGIAMGKAGTEVARQASSIVLTDDDFSTIVAAVEEGRAIFGNIKRTIQYLLSTNLAEILIMFGTVILGFPMPLAPLNLLWINLVTDGFPSLALSAEPVAKNFLKSSVRPSPKSFFDKKFLAELFIVAIIMTILTMYIYYYALKTSDLLTAKSYVFTLMVYLSLFRSFSCRSEEKAYFELPFNPWHFASVIVPVGLQFGLQYTALFQKLFGVRSLTLNENVTLFFFSLIPVTLVEINKFRGRK
jgi:Ca2+-transporting ATPase